MSAMPKYGIRYIQTGEWLADCATLTDRGYEAWLGNYSRHYVRDGIEARSWTDLNTAYRNLSAYLDNESWFYLVEEIPA